ncbi:CpXC domain-containing protein [Candidatus Ruminimicrobiellum ovillum]|uniref:CpXC domain-containing protein n=1 Tax=Candidatus Ruminimicrobiellum ovillum TaxID=1947927 RepID=UPI00355978EA
MSILSNCEIKCSCGETFEAELWKAINVFDDPDLKEVLLSGRFNTVECPKCHKVFYHEHFFMYQDLQNELIAYVYPKEDEKNAKSLRKKMLSDFTALSKEIEELASIDFEPVIYFGVEDLINTIKNEDYIKDEIDILTFIAKRIELDLIKIKPAKARNLCILHTIPKSKKSSGDIKKDIVSGLEQLLKYNPNLAEYENFLARIKQNLSCLDEILLHKKEK